MLTLWIDTNQARAAKPLKQLAQLARRKGVVPIVHPQVYLETRRQKRVMHGPAFSPSIFDELLTQCRIECPAIAFDQARVSTWADLLAARYPSDQLWQRAKHATIGGELASGYDVLPGSLPMTTDWLIALEVELESDGRVLTADTGEEWRTLRESGRVFGWDGAVAWLNSLPDL